VAIPAPCAYSLLSSFFRAHKYCIHRYWDYTGDTVRAPGWLDLAEKACQSCTSISSQSGTGGMFPEWRYPIVAETRYLLQESGSCTGRLIDAPPTQLRIMRGMLWHRSLMILWWVMAI
jgi:hypothetical protein